VNLGRKPSFRRQNNTLEKIDKRTIIDLRKKLNAFLRATASKNKSLSQKEKNRIDQRLRGLGYIK